MLRSGLVTLCTELGRLSAPTWIKAAVHLNILEFWTPKWCRRVRLLQIRGKITLLKIILSGFRGTAGSGASALTGGGCSFGRTPDYFRH